METTPEEPGTTRAVVRPAVLVTLLGAVLASGLGQQVWYDEAYTILSYVVTGPAYALTHYRVPNNHVLLSVLLGLLPVHSEPIYRLVSILAASASLWFVCRSVRRLAPQVSTAAITNTVVAGALGLPVFLCFATQIRGYALSMLLGAAAFDMLMARREEQSPVRGLAYVALGAALIATIPTNVMFLACLAFADLASLPTRPGRLGMRLLRSGWPHALALSGVLIYMFVVRDLVAAMRHGWGWQSHAHLLAVMSVALLPGGVMLPAIAWLKRGPATLLTFPARRFAVSLGVGVLFMLAALPLAGIHLFPRSFVVFVPLVITASCLVTLAAGEGPGLRLAVLATAMVGIVFWLLSVNLFLKDGGSAGKHIFLPPYFEAADFDPASPIALLKARPRSSILVAENRDETVSDTFALYYQAVLAGLEGRFAYASQVAGRGGELLSMHRELLLVARFGSDFERMCHELGLDPGAAIPIKTSGFYKVWLVQSARSYGSISPGSRSQP